MLKREISKTKEYTEIKVWSEDSNYKINFEDPGFYVDVIDALWTTFCTNHNYPPVYKTFSINGNNYTNYFNYDENSLSKNGIQIWLENEYTLLIRILEKQFKNGNYEEPIGFNTSRIIVSFDYDHILTETISNQYDSEDYNVNLFRKNKENFKYTAVELSPKILMGEIEILNGEDSKNDPQLKTTERRPDFIFNNENNNNYFYANTSAGTKLQSLICDDDIEEKIITQKNPEECVPTYIIKNSAFIPLIYTSSSEGMEPNICFDWKNTSSFIIDNTGKKQKIQYEFIQGTSSEGIELIEDSILNNSTNKRKNLFWEIQQFLTTSVSSSFTDFKVIFDVPLSGEKITAYGNE